MADDGPHESQAAGNESEAPPEAEEEWVGASGPFIIDAGGKGDGVALWPLLAGGQLLHFAPQWQGGRRPTSDVKTARQTLSSVTLVTQCVIHNAWESHGMPVNRALCAKH